MSTTFEPGQYLGKVTSWAMVKAKNENKTPQFALTFLVLGRLDPQNPDGDLLEAPEVERTIFRPVTENTAAWLLRDLKELFEYPHESFAPLDPDSPDRFSFSDKEFTASLAHEEFDGKTREKWNFATGMYFGDPMTHEEVRKLDALFGKAKPKRNGRKPKPKPQPQPEAAQAPQAAAAPAPPAPAEVPI